VPKFGNIKLMASAVASALSGAFGGLLAFAILHMNGVAGYAGWRWLYIIEGLITIAYAVTTIFLIPKHYSTAYFLNAEEKAVMKRREEIMEAYSGGTGHYTKEDVKLAAQDIKTWLHGPIQIAVVTILYGMLADTPSTSSVLTRRVPGFGTFLPIILKFGFKFTTLQAQYLVIPGL
jgi:hypothetical protein